MTPDAIEQKYLVRPERYREQGGSGRRGQRQPDRRARRRGQDRRQVDQRVRRPRRRRGQRRQDQGQGRRQPARPPGRRAAQLRPQRAASATSSCRWGPPTCAGRAGTGRPCTRCSTRSSSGCCASGCIRTWTRSSPRPSRASTWPRTCWRRVRWPAGWPGTPPRRPVGVAVTGQFGRGTGSLTGIAVATGDGPAAWFDPAALDDTDEPAVAAWLADTDRPKVIHDAKPAMLAFARARLGAGRRPGRHRAGGVSGQARPAGLRPDRPGPALPQAGAAGRRAAGRASSRWTGWATTTATRPSENLMLRARATLDLADAHHRGTVPRRRRLPAAADGGRAAAVGGAGRDGARRHRRRHRIPVRARGPLRGRGEIGPAGGARGGRAGVQPRLAQAVAGDPVHRARPAQDQADQVRATPPTRTRCRACSRRPAIRCWRTCCGTATWPSSSRRWTGCSSRSPTTGASTPRSTRPWPPPAGCRRPTRTCRTSRSAPRRAGASAARSSSAKASIS